MHRTPLQTLLAERMQSAKGLGWDFETTKKAAGDAAWAKQSVSDMAADCWARFTSPNLRRWFRVAR